MSAPDTLASRISQPGFPQLLAGPIVRHLAPDQATVWVALRAGATVRLTVVEQSGGTTREVLAGTRATVALGANLHVAAVTATGEERLLEGRVYHYDLRIGGVGLTSPGVAPPLGYGGDALPSFSLPPRDLDRLRLVHGSCRKPHAPGADALPALDRMIAEARASAGGEATAFAYARPHQLFLTGDQIYADDVADDLLAIVTEAGEALLGWSETLPGTGGKSPADFAPGERAETVLDIARLTSPIPSPSYSKSHLLGLGEYYAMYLLSLSECIWPERLPEDGDPAERAAVERYRATIPPCRRALANVPTYATFDDHEVSDDWNMNRAWCERVLATGLGRRIVQNALAAYAVFQAWGNTPERFGAGAAGEPGRALLDALAAWRGEEADPHAATIARRTGVPSRVGPGGTLEREPGALEWHYRVALPQRAYEVLVLDTRTARVYEPDPMQPAGRLSPAGRAAQIGAHPAPLDDRLTIVVSPAPILGAGFLARRQAAATGDGVWDLDAEAWSLHTDAFRGVLDELASRNRRVVVLSGDVHFGYAAQMSDPERDSELVQLTSSAMHNRTSTLVTDEHVRELVAGVLYESKTAEEDAGGRRMRYARGCTPGAPDAHFVAVDNLGEVRFEGDVVAQVLWWRSAPDVDPAPRTTYSLMFQRASAARNRG